MGEPREAGTDADSEAHWQGVYALRDPQEVSWYEPAPEASLACIEKLALPPDAAILDAGGGPSALAGELVRRGYTDVTARAGDAWVGGAGVDAGGDAVGTGWGQS